MKNNKKGFTLAELLIVVAIIAVLVGISIPVFTNQLEKSRDAVSVANMRTAYAEASTTKLVGESSGGNTTLNADGTVTVTGVAFKGEKVDDFSGLAAELPFTVGTEPAKGAHSMTFTWDANNTVTAAIN